MIAKILNFISSDLKASIDVNDNRYRYALQIHNITFFLCLAIAFAFFVDTGYHANAMVREIIDFFKVDFTDVPNAPYQLKTFYLVAFMVSFVCPYLYFLFIAFKSNVKFYFTVLDVILFVIGLCLINITFFLATWWIASYIGFLPYQAFAVLLQTLFIVKMLSVYVFLIFNLFSKFYYTMD